MFVTNNVARIKENIDLNKIFYCKSVSNLADIGSKFARLNRSTKISAEKVSPISIHINGDTHLIIFHKSFKDGIFIKGYETSWG